MPIEVQILHSVASPGEVGSPPNVEFEGVVRQIGHVFPPGEADAEMWLQHCAHTPEFYAIEDRSKIKAWIVDTTGMRERGHWILYGYVRVFDTRVETPLEEISTLGSTDVHYIQRGPTETLVKLEFYCMDSHMPFPNYSAMGSTMFLGVPGSNGVHIEFGQGQSVPSLYGHSSLRGVREQIRTIEDMEQYMSGLSSTPRVGGQTTRSRVQRLREQLGIRHPERANNELLAPILPPPAEIGRIITPTEDACVHHHANNQDCEICRDILGNLQTTERRGEHRLSASYVRGNPRHVEHITELISNPSLMHHSATFVQLESTLRRYGRGVDPDAVLRSMQAYLPGLSVRERNDIMALYYTLRSQWE